MTLQLPSGNLAILEKGGDLSTLPSLGAASAMPHRDQAQPLDFVADCSVVTMKACTLNEGFRHRSASFIDPALVRHRLQNTSHLVVNLEKLTYANNLESLPDASKYTG